MEISWKNLFLKSALNNCKSVDQEYSQKEPNPVQRTAEKDLKEKISGKIAIFFYADFIHCTTGGNVNTQCSVNGAFWSCVIRQLLLFLPRHNPKASKSRTERDWFFCHLD